MKSTDNKKYETRREFTYNHFTAELTAARIGGVWKFWVELTKDSKSDVPPYLRDRAISMLKTLHFLAYDNLQQKTGRALTPFELEMERWLRDAELQL